MKKQIQPHNDRKLPLGWMWVHLGDIVTLQNGDRSRNYPGVKDFVEQGVPFINAGHIKNDCISIEDMNFITQAKFESLRSGKIEHNDFVFCIRGSLGKWAIMKNINEGAIASSLIIIRCSDLVLPEFMKAYMRSSICQTNIHLFDNGAAQPNISAANLRNFDFPLPPLPTQKKIASILSAYDDLIENNERRIKILEEMAQSIYREWFVNFRFPGHENVKMVESELGLIPEGWEVRPYAEVAEFINGFAFKPVHWQETGKPIVKIKELKNGITGDTPRYHGDDIDSKYHITNGDLLFSWSGDLDAYIWVGGDALLNQHLFHVIPESVVSKQFLFHSLRNSMQRFRSLTTGSTLHHIKRSALTEVSTVWPSESVTSEFGQISTRISTQTLGYQRTIENLRQTRDLLLPKLISGQIDVEDLDIKVA